jgi:hypothetical protein
MKSGPDREKPGNQPINNGKALIRLHQDHFPSKKKGNLEKHRAMHKLHVCFLRRCPETKTEMRPVCPPNHQIAGNLDRGKINSLSGVPVQQVEQILNSVPLNKLLAICRFTPAISFEMNWLRLYFI